MRVVIVGAGYVGLTLGVAAAKVGYEVLFVDINPEIVTSLNKRQATFYEKGLQEALDSLFTSGKDIAFSNLKDLFICHQPKQSVFVVSLGTPLGPDSKALLTPILKVTEEVVQWMQSNDLLILRSTVAVGTTRHLLNTVKGLQNISFCPERTIEGKALEELHTLPQVVSGSSPLARDLASDFFRKITPDVLQAESLETAELIKLASNTFRDLNFAYANLLALIANEHGVNVNELINLSNFRYERNIIALPGLVGGPCLEKDAYILAQSYPGSESRLILEARKLNENMVPRAIKFIETHSTKDSNLTVLVCGAAFKGRPVTSDTRGSFVFLIIDGLCASGFKKENIHVLDPVVNNLVPGITVLNHLDQLQGQYDFMIQLTNHELFESPPFNSFIDECVSHVVSFWPRKIGNNKSGKSLYLGGVN
ncbi:MAG: nucleotide sugar dehydrogenase [Desulfuromonadaceae bacterium]|nr:nucleotide sugar dehydrogenase [Desulfuromonadaceae bacterium]MDD2854570.1 nucleotide sugar dehydrogenase [Desulfuromonadaceae bacterium]